MTNPQTTRLKKKELANPDGPLLSWETFFTVTGARADEWFAVEL